MKLFYENSDYALDSRIASYRRTMGRLAGGISVVLSGGAGNPCGMTINSLVSASLEPLLLLFCARLQSKTAKVAIETGVFSANILAEDQWPVARYFSGQDRSSPDFTIESSRDHIWIKETVGSLLCSVESTHRAGDHDIIIGRVSEIIDNPERPSPLLYHEGRYRSLGPVCTVHDGTRRETASPLAPDRR